MMARVKAIRTYRYSRRLFKGPRHALSSMSGRRVSMPVLPRWLRSIAVVAAMTTILVVSSIPVPTSGSIQIGSFDLSSLSLWFHVVGYAGLTFLLLYALFDYPYPRWQLLGVAFLVPVGYGLVIELIQGSIPYRNFSQFDVAVNAIGPTVSIAVWQRIVEKYVHFYQISHTVETESPRN